MTRSTNQVEARLTGLAQRIFEARATDDPEPPGVAREVVDKAAALGALDIAPMGVHRVYDGAPMDVELVSHISALLMVTREYIEPLPGGTRQDGTDGLTPDLVEMKERLRDTGALDWTIRERLRVRGQGDVPKGQL